MATIDGRPAKYGIALKQLRELMEMRGVEGVEFLQREYGGVNEIIKKLYTSHTSGNSYNLFSIIDIFIFVYP